MKRITALVCFAVTLAIAAAARPQDEGPPKQEIGSAEHFLEIFEKKVDRAHGQPMRLGYEENEALKRIRALKERFPADAKVEELFQRAKTALLASKGETFVITPEMLAYRENEKKMVKLFSEEADKLWPPAMEKILAGGALIEKPWPAPGVRDVAADEMIGKTVVLEGFEYPTNQFYEMGREFVFVGSGTRGYYFVDIGNRKWICLYEALKRYRRLVNSGLTEGMPWTMVGRITNLELLVPDAAEKKVGAAQWGWSVMPEGILVPGLTCAMLDPETELGATFAGESRMREIKDPLYTVKSVPDDVTPERLVEIFATAIKEKNFDLYVDCIDPARRATKTAMSLLRYHWDLHQSRFAEFYCAITIVPERTEITVLHGFDPEADNEGFFLDEKEKENIRERAEPLEEEAVVWTKAWTEKGLQYGSEKPHYLRRAEKKRWYVNTYAYQY
jgi:hypothetical protein